MSFLNSILFCKPGSYTVLGIPVSFTKNNTDASAHNLTLNGAGVISYLARACINNQVFQYLSFGYSHVFIHELGHALTSRILTGNSTPSITIDSSCNGFTSECIADSRWKDSLILSAGPMFDIAFCSFQLIAAASLKKHSKIVSGILGFSAVIWMAGELLYAYTSVINDDGGDFGSIARNGKTHLALASAALISECALSIFTAIKMT